MTTNSETQATTAGTATALAEPKTPKGARKGNVAPQKPRVAPGKTKSGNKAAPVKKAPKAAKAAKQAKVPAGSREGSKTAAVVSLLEQKNGATLAELMQATGWQAHSVRGFISGALSKKMGRRVESSKREDGERVYKIKG